MENSSKTILIFGATGRTGQEIVKECESKGIIAAIFNKRSPGLNELRQAVKNTDGVIMVFGPRPPYKEIYCHKLTESIIEAMKAENVLRLVCQTGAMIGDYRQNRSFLFQKFSDQFRKKNPQGYNDRVNQEKAVKNSSLNWTIVKPPRLTQGQKNGTAKAAENLKVSLLSSISRKTIAQFIVGEFFTPKFLKKTVFVKN
ncbi:hypothetical protein C4569_00135 [Candidatus Parcubacteria bacterium]|nr:MAG: hypothetical protein C4569_00135 [Candidatus Parcubacteria bacterium]